MTEQYLSLELTTNPTKTTAKHIKSISIICIAFLFLSWIMLEPISAPPDELEHDIYAAATVRLEDPLPLLRITPLPIWSAKVPGWIPSIYNASPPLYYTDTHGYSRNPDGEVDFGNNRIVSTSTDLAHLPPFYYLFVGIPTLFNGSLTTFFSMRLISALMSMFFVGYALCALFKSKRGPLSLAGFLLALTPESYFLANTVNPNGTEIIASACLWVFTGLLVTSNQDERGELFKKFAVTAGTLSLMRTLSPLWVLLAGIYILIGLGMKESLDILKFKKNIKWTVFAFLGGSATFIWDIFRGEYTHPILFYLGSTYHTKPFFGRFIASIMRTGVFLSQGYSNLRNVISPIGTLIWLLLIGIGLVVALVRSKVRFKIILLLSIASSVILPAYFEASKGELLGPWWNGRYSLPIYVSMPILSLIFVKFRNSSKKINHYYPKYFSLLCVGFVLLGQFISIYELTRVSMVGLNGKVDILLSSSATWRSYPYGWQDVWLIVNLIASSILFWKFWSFSNSVYARDSVRRVKSEHV